MLIPHTENKGTKKSLPTINKLSISYSIGNSKYKSNQSYKWTEVLLENYTKYLYLKQKNNIIFYFTFYFFVRKI